MVDPSAASAKSPVVVRGHLREPLSRWLWLVKWVLLIPHYVVLIVLWVAFLLATVVAFFAILGTGRHPVGLFGFKLGVLRWSWRVAYYGYNALGTDRYPPFSLGEQPDYPATLDVAYPGQMSRGLVLVKWWLLALPHYLVVAIFVGGGGWTYTAVDGTSGRDGATLASGSLIGLLVAIAGIALLFTARYPHGLYNLIMGLNRWVLRVVAYAALMTDVYPPFRLDQGESEPGPRVDPTPSAFDKGSSEPNLVVPRAPLPV